MEAVRPKRLEGERRNAKNSGDGIFFAGLRRQRTSTIDDSQVDLCAPRQSENRCRRRRRSDDAVEYPKRGVGGGDSHDSQEEQNVWRQVRSSRRTETLATTDQMTQLCCCACVRPLLLPNGLKRSCCVRASYTGRG